MLIALLPCNDMLSREAAFLEIRLFQILFCKWFNQVILFEVEKSVDLWNKKISNYIYKLTSNISSGFSWFDLIMHLCCFSFKPREKGRMKFHKIQNVQIALEYLSKKGVSIHYKCVDLFAKSLFSTSFEVLTWVKLNL